MIPFGSPPPPLARAACSSNRAPGKEGSVIRDDRLVAGRVYQ